MVQREPHDLRHEGLVENDEDPRLSFTGLNGGLHCVLACSPAHAGSHGPDGAEARLPTKSVSRGTFKTQYLDMEKPGAQGCPGAPGYTRPAELIGPSMPSST